MQTKLIRLFCFGSSQWPLIPHGSIAEVVPASLRPVRPGDLIAYQSADRIICHRLLKSRFERGTWEWLAKGDANLAPDGWIPAHAVIGTVVQVNGKDLSSGWRWALSKSLFRHARIQCSLIEAFRRSPISKLLKRRLSDSGLIQRALSLIVCPWLLFQPRLQPALSAEAAHS
jgi:hypothetical protein